MANDYIQVEGLDYHHICVPTTKLVFVRCVLVVSIALISIFTIWMWLKPSYIVIWMRRFILLYFMVVVERERIVFVVWTIHFMDLSKLHRFGILSSPVLIEANYAQSLADHSMFTRNSTSYFIVLIYVEDIFQSLFDLKNFPTNHFKSKNLTTWKLFLGNKCWKNWWFVCI